MGGAGPANPRLPPAVGPRSSLGTSPLWEPPWRCRGCWFSKFLFLGSSLDLLQFTTKLGGPASFSWFPVWMCPIFSREGRPERDQCSQESIRGHFSHNLKVRRSLVASGPQPC